MSHRLWVYLVIVVVGLIILFYPEQDDTMLIEFSDKHGPSRLDLLGIFILMIGYIPMIGRVVWRYNVIVSTLGKTKTFLLVSLSLLSLIMIPIALNLSSESLLWTSVTASTIAQAMLIYFAFVK